MGFTTHTPPRPFLRLVPRWLMSRGATTPRAQSLEEASRSSLKGNLYAILRFVSRTSDKQAENLGSRLPQQPTAALQLSSRARQTHPGCDRTKTQDERVVVSLQQQKQQIAQSLALCTAYRFGALGPAVRSASSLLYYGIHDTQPTPVCARFAVGRDWAFGYAHCTLHGRVSHQSRQSAAQSSRPNGPFFVAAFYPPLPRLISRPLIRYTAVGRGVTVLSALALLLLLLTLSIGYFFTNILSLWMESEGSRRWVRLKPSRYPAVSLDRQAACGGADSPEGVRRPQSRRRRRRRPPQIAAPQRPGPVYLASGTLPRAWVRPARDRIVQQRRRQADQRQGGVGRWAAIRSLLYRASPRFPRGPGRVLSRIVQLLLQELAFTRPSLSPSFVISGEQEWIPINALRKPNLILRITHLLPFTAGQELRDGGVGKTKEGEGGWGGGFVIAPTVATALREPYFFEMASP
ncbi:hypothetical protein CPLU01_08786 [Colletotrichum plurivorum]|uniref:Uncharacterized protein n=1 Tax=Colletotrichum plurivorum TaxID=2175906 RepID=A0A8H6KC15_9PEZI|nr:hypothetical protein CPLU01_08786 [Colletotrichum plurivorum]